MPSPTRRGASTSPARRSYAAARGGSPRPRDEEARTTPHAVLRGPPPTHGPLHHHELRSSEDSLTTTSSALLGLAPGLLSADSWHKKHSLQQPNPNGPVLTPTYPAADNQNAYSPPQLPDHRVSRCGQEGAGVKDMIAAKTPIVIEKEALLHFRRTRGERPPALSGLHLALAPKETRREWREKVKKAKKARKSCQPAVVYSGEERDGGELFEEEEQSGTFEQAGTSNEEEKPGASEEEKPGASEEDKPGTSDEQEKAVKVAGGFPYEGSSKKNFPDPTSVQGTEIQGGAVADYDVEEKKLAGEEETPGTSEEYQYEQDDAQEAEEKFERDRLAGELVITPQHEDHATRGRARTMQDHPARRRGRANKARRRDRVGGGSRSKKIFDGGGPPGGRKGTWIQRRAARRPKGDVVGLCQICTDSFVKTR